MTETDTELTNDSKSTSASLKRGSKTATLILAGLIVLLGATSIYLYTQNRDVKKKNDALTKKDPQKEIDSITQKVKKLIELPSKEKPTLATVTDNKKLAEQPFFKNAENGDKILIFAESKKAIIYRPSENKIINVGPIAITADETTTTVPEEDTTTTTTKKK